MKVEIVEPIDRDIVMASVSSTMSKEITTLKTEPTTFLINNPYRYEEIWVDPNIPKFNHKKHIQTCILNRKKRKKRKKRK